MQTYLLAFALLAPLTAQTTPTGLWDASVALDSMKVPFRMEFQGSAETLKGALLDGDNRIWSTQGSVEGGKLHLRWDFFDSDLRAEWKDGAWQGEYVRRTRAGLVRRPFEARPYQAAADPGKADVSLAGHWILKTDSTSRANVMEAIFRQSGAELTGTVQRVDGDFGVLEGKIAQKSAILSHFDGIRATLLEVSIQSDGTLAGTLNGKVHFTGARTEKATALGIPQPPDPARYTSVKDPSVPFAFRFQDLDGNWVANTDDRFKNKVVLATLTGSWCPNCHDEAPVLADLYRRFHAKGLEVVALGFEYTGEVERDREQLRAFSRRHELPYTVLLAGTTEDGEIEKKLPQIKNFGAFPTTFFLGRDGRVRAVHAGFAGPANPEQHQRLVKETQELVERLLAE